MEMQMRWKTAAAIAATMVLAAPTMRVASAHSGGLDASGCHHDRKNGGYHCHRAPSANVAPKSRVAPQSNSNSETVYFRNCSEARAAGAAPVRRGDPGYAPHLDRDNDGIGCE